MDQLRNHADRRLTIGCTYCWGENETRDHVPSKVLLDAPFPENLPVVYSCRKCNNGFSVDEEYFACLIEAAIASSTEPDEIRRKPIGKIFREKPALRARIDKSREIRDGIIHFVTEDERFARVILKLAQGHASFDLSQPLRGDPKSIRWLPLVLMPESERESFESPSIIESLGEVGSRGMQRLYVTQLILRSPAGEEKSINLIVNDWVDVQKDFYRYLAIDNGDEVVVRMVVREFLACEVIWNSSKEL